ncbi:MAG: lipocalin-like domain-containing protein [Candidatus Andersenbacteria bacterium]
MSRHGVRFPRDERAHDVDYEWWYVHGYLGNEAGHRFAFMYCFFKFKRDAVARYFPQLRSYPARTLYTLDLGLTDVAAQTHHADELIFLPWLGHTRVGRLRFGVRLGANWLRKLTRQRYALHLEHHQRRIDLHLFDQQGAVLHGRDGVLGVRGFGETLYYSQPRLRAEGRLELPDGSAEYVHGNAWIDHQWGDFLPEQPFMFWTWIGAQLDDGSTLMLFQFFGATGRVIAVRGTWTGAAGRRRTFTDATLTPLHTWRSGKSDVRYPVDVELAVPALRLLVRLHADVRDQEMHSSFFSYWEGACTVVGMHAGHAIGGKAYLEHTGYDLMAPPAVERRLHATR